MKIAVLGYSGSGKSTLAKALGARYCAPVLHLDTVHFLPGWRERDRDEARAVVAAFLDREAWVIDGNYASLLREERLAQADQIVFLAFSRLNCLSRVFRRYLAHRNTTRESMAEGCEEKLDTEFAWWVVHQGRTRARREEYRVLLEAYREKTTVLKSQLQLDTFCAELE